LPSIFATLFHYAEGFMAFQAAFALRFDIFASELSRHSFSDTFTPPSFRRLAAADIISFDASITLFIFIFSFHFDIIDIFAFRHCRHISLRFLMSLRH
jgi:hypothetical protein